MEIGKTTYFRLVDNIESITRIDFSIYTNEEVEINSKRPVFTTF